MSDENAFPKVTSDRFDGADCVSAVWSEGGLTKRELFAAVAMLGVECSNVNTASNEALSIKEVASRSAKIADALLAELAKVRK